MVWLADGEKSVRVWVPWYSFWQNVRTWQTDTHGWTPHDGIGCTCTPSSGKTCTLHFCNSFVKAISINTVTCSCHWLIDWSKKLCQIPDYASIRRCFSSSNSCIMFSLTVWFAFTAARVKSKWCILWCLAVQTVVANLHHTAGDCFYTFQQDSTQAVSKSCTWDHFATVTGLQTSVTLETDRLQP